VLGWSPKAACRLTDDEVQRLAEAAKANRHGQRDTTMILIAY